MKPTDLYLLALQSDKSRVVMKSRLNLIAKMMQGTKVHSDLNWSKVNYPTILGFISKLQSEGKEPTTINNYIAAIKGAAKEAWHSKLLSVEDYQRIKEIKRIKGSRTEKGRSLSVSELRKMIDFDEDDFISIRDSAIIALSYGAGLRRSEVSDLDISDVNFETNKITVLGKGNKQCENAVSPKLMEYLNKWVNVRGSQSGKLFLRVNKGNRLTEKGISDQSVYNIVKARTEVSGLTEVSPHDLRRSFATNLLENDVDLFTVSKLMRHSNIETTRVYDKRGVCVQDNAAKNLQF